MPLWGLALAVGFGLILLGAGLMVAGVAVGMFRRPQAQVRPATVPPSPARSVSPANRRSATPPILRGAIPPALQDGAPTEWLKRPKSAAENADTQWLPTRSARPGIDDDP